MKLSPDSPELTAFALGQLPPGQVAEIETALAAAPELMSEIEAIRATAALLEGELAAETSLRLSGQQREEILRGAGAAFEGSSAETLEARPASSGWVSRIGAARERFGRRMRVPWRRDWVLGAFGFGTAAVAVFGLFFRAEREAFLSEATDGPAVTFHAPSEPPVSAEIPPAPTPTPRDQQEIVVASKPVPEGVRAIDGSPAEGAPLVQTPVPAPVKPASGPLPSPKTPMKLDVAQSAPRATADAIRSKVPANRPAEPQRSALSVSGGVGGQGPTGLSESSLSLSQAAPLTDELGAAPASLQPSLAHRYGLAPSTATAGGSASADRSRALASGNQPLSLGKQVKREMESRVASEALPREGRGGVVVASGPATDFYRKSAEESPRRYWGYLPAPSSGGESYGAVVESLFKDAEQAPLSTFSIDVDTSSYSNARRFLREGQLPPPDAVRIEELLNYFPYEYEGPSGGGHPFAIHLEQAACPWNAGHRLLRVAVKAREERRAARPHANLVFLIDVSGSMAPENKLPLVKRSLRMLVDRLGASDNVGIVTYAGRAEIALPPASCDNKEEILAAIEGLAAGSGTNGGDGIQSAYAMARGQFQKAAVNRVILCTDGDFNIGITTHEALQELIAREARSGVFLSVLGFGMGNLKDSTMELLAHKGNGHYAYIDSFAEARKVLSEQLEGTLVAVAKDVKIQIEFNPRQVARWRQIGYENRVLAAADFQDDSKDAGEVGAGHSITALYEIAPVSDRFAVNGQPLRYQAARPARREGDLGEHRDEWLHVKIRYKKPDGDSSVLMEAPFRDRGLDLGRASADFKWAAAVAQFGMLLRDSSHKGTATFASTLRLAEQGLGADAQGYRSEFIDLVRKAEELKRRR